MRLTVNSDFSVGTVVRLLAFFLGIILLLRFFTGASYVFLLLAFLALQRRRADFTFFILIIIASLNVVNNAFFDKSVHFYVAQRVTMFGLGLFLLVQNAGMNLANKRIVAPFRVLILYTLVLMVTSLAGWQPVVSELKALLFLIFLGAFVQGTAGIIKSKVDSRFIRAAMLAVASFYILGSIAVIPFPSIGQSMLITRLEDTSNLQDYGLFNGVTWHSQTLGPMLALLNAFLFSDYVFNVRRRHWLYAVLLIAVPCLIYYTSSRTGMLAYLLSILFTSFYFFKSRRISQGRKSKFLSGAMLTVLVIALAVVVNPRLLVKAEAYLRKGGPNAEENMDRSSSLSEDMTRSRMGLIERGWANFKASPIYGNGFQVSEDLREKQFSSFSDYMSAPVEKGFLPTMILEEGGVIGTALFLLFLANLFVTYLKLNFNCFLSVFTTLVCINSGEALFFSTSAIGGVCWMICFSALLMDVHHMRLDQAEQEQQRMQLAQQAQLRPRPMHMLRPGDASPQQGAP